MITFVTGNLLDSDCEALVNTVNTVGVMGKGIALMFKEAFPENFKAYEAACKAGQVQIGHMFVTARHALYGPKWIINFPTKKHWRQPSKLEWVREGLADLKAVIRSNNITSIALPPLGAGNGGLEWKEVRATIESSLADLRGVEVKVYEPTPTYQNVAKRSGVEKLTPARALVTEMVRRYSILGMECSLLEIQKLAWFISVACKDLGLEDPLQLAFEANRYGPYSDGLRHLLNSLDGSYLHSAKRINDAAPLEPVWFDDSRKEVLELYLRAEEPRVYKDALEMTSRVIDGFESPLGMEILATVDWLLRQGVEASEPAIIESIRRWPGGEVAAKRKMRIFDSRLVGIALERLTSRA
jgi:O-acetyl-ADP-ribose deacetylase (regulator of RNase III)